MNDAQEFAVLCLLLFAFSTLMFYTAGIPFLDALMATLVGFTVAITLAAAANDP